MERAARTRAHGLHLTIAGVSLVLLAILSFGLSFVELGRLALPVALLIAAIKATIVLLAFMELNRERSSIQLALLAVAFMLSLLVAFTVADVVTREPVTLNPKETGPAEPVPFHAQP